MGVGTLVGHAIGPVVGLSPKRNRANHIPELKPKRKEISVVSAVTPRIKKDRNSIASSVDVNVFLLIIGRYNRCLMSHIQRQ